MTSSTRAAFLALLCLVGGGLIATLSFFQATTPLRSSFAPAFQLLGHSTKVVDGLIARVMPIDAVDEADLGRVIAAGYARGANASDAAALYLNDLVQHQAAMMKRPFSYRAYIVESPEPNAMALPGGVILVTRGLLATLRTEAELMAVVAHELGHVELGHCFDQVKFELLARKLTRASYGHIADVAVNLMLRHSFSKTLEDQADEYAYALLVQTPYDPRGVAGAFDRLLQAQGGGASQTSHANPIRDYLLSHPPLPLRKDKFAQRADAWWQQNPSACRFTGVPNLAQRRSFYTGFQPANEWTGTAAATPCTPAP